jgi:hypothetical protein
VTSHLKVRQQRGYSSPAPWTPAIKRINPQSVGFLRVGKPRKSKTATCLLPVADQHLGHLQSENNITTSQSVRFLEVDKPLCLLHAEHAAHSSPAPWTPAGKNNIKKWFKKCVMFREG